MQEFDKKHIEKTRIPSQCPFCRDKGGYNDEFRVVYGEQHYLDSKGWHNCNYEPEVHVFCTVCDEEVREEDVGVIQ